MFNNFTTNGIVINYIQHHLQHLQINLFNNIKYISKYGWLNVDTILVSFFISFIFLWFVKYNITLVKYNKLPNKLQIFFEILIFFIYKNTIDIFKKKNRFVFTLAFTVFTWISLMNLMSLIPVDIIPTIVFYLGGYHNFFLVPTSDINLTFALSFFVIMLIYGYKITHYKYSRYVWKNFYLFPFRTIILILCYFFSEIINICSKLLSLSLRLFGNIYSGEIIFIILYGLVPLWGQFFVIIPWMIFHFFVSFLQAFIFMILVLIYIS